MPAVISGLGCSAPEGNIGRGDSAEFAIRTSCIPEPLARRVRALYRKTGIDHRGSVLINTEKNAPDGYQDFYPIAADTLDLGPSTQRRLERYEVEAPRLALNAARLAIQDSGLSASVMTHLINVTCTGFYSPGLDIALINGLKLALDTQRVQIGFMGCHASINALRTAKALVKEDPSRAVLISCVELCSLHYQYGFETDHLVSNAIFADGASAVVVTGNDNHQKAQSQNGNPSPQCGNYPLAISQTGSILIPHTDHAMTWKIGDHGFKMTLSAEVPDLIRKQLKPKLTKWLKQNGLNLAHINGWAVHPGGTRILDAVQESLDLGNTDLEFSRSILREHGNMSSATLLFIIKKMREQQVARPWLMLGFGPGLEIEAALIQ